MSIVNIAMLVIIVLCAIAVGIELRRGNKKAAIRNTVIAAVLLVLCALSLATKRPETSQPHVDDYVDETSQIHVDGAPDEILVHDDGTLQIYGRKPGTEGSPENPPAKPKDPTAGADVGKNIDPAPDTDTNNGIGVATSMH